MNFEEGVKIFKSLSDINRLKIIDLLSHGEKCACEILKNFDFTQPTLSHHMKILLDCGLISCRKDGLWTYYSLNNINCNKMMLMILTLVTKE